MLKKNLKIIGISLGIAIATGIIYFNTLTYKDIEVIEGEVTFSGTEKESKEKAVFNLDIGETKKYEMNDLNFYFNGKEMDLEKNVYEQNQRYYLELDDFLSKSNVEYKKENSIYSFENCKLDLSKGEFYLNGKLYYLRGEKLQGLENYVALNDLEHMLNLRDKWDQEKRKIYLFNEKKNLELDKKSTQKSGKAAMMRVEDFAPGGDYLKSDVIEKYKIIADYLYSKDFKFNVAWISRYRNPAKGIDNNLLEDRSIANVQYINLMDHLIFRGGIIGLHGYTHQNGDEVSAVGSDLSMKVNNTEAETEELLKNAIKTAEKLNVPVDFFESAHYHSTMKQQRVIEKYFDVIYEPFKYYLLLNPLRSPMDKSTIYIPTPLGYVTDERGEEIANKIRKNQNRNVISSFYFHPIKEFKFISLGDIDENGYVDYNYDENSIMHNISQALEETNQVTITARELR